MAVGLRILHADTGGGERRPATRQRRLKKQEQWGRETKGRWKRALAGIIKDGEEQVV